MNTTDQKAIDEWMSRFNYVIMLDKGRIDRDELKEWCASIIGQEYKDWYMFPGARNSVICMLYIVDGKMNNLACLRWSDCLAN